jgi:hypothetical protein
METPTGDPLGTSSCISFPVRLHIHPLFNKLHGYQHGEKTGIQCLQAVSKKL